MTDLNNNSDAQAPPLNNPTPTSMPAAPDVNNAGVPAAALAPSSLVQTNPPPLPAPAPNTNMDANTHQSLIGKVFQTIAGGQTKDYVQTDKGPVPVKRNLKPGEMARNILGAAFSMFAAGLGGMNAAREGRQYVQNPATSVGAVIHGPEEQRQAEAEKQFQNNQAADQMTLLKHRDAMEQQRSIQEAVQAEDAHQAAVQARVNGQRDMDEKAYDDMVKQQKDFNTALAMPGAQIVKDTNGQELSFLSPREAQAYAIKHPEILHGSTNGDSKFGTVMVKNPATGQYQIVDYPADRHDIGIANFGQKKDRDGNPVWNKDGSPVPDGTVLDPKTKKPTVLTQTVTPDQARAIAVQNIQLADVQSQMKDREAQAEKYRADARKNDELNSALDLYDQGALSKMTDRQRQIVARYLFQQQTLMSSREKQANDNLQKVLAANGGDTKNEEAVAAQKEYDDAKEAYDNATYNWQTVSGNTAGVQLGNKLIRESGPNPDWNKVDATIKNSGLPEVEQERAKAKVWNSLTPQQQEAIKTKNTTATKIFDPTAWKAANPSGDVTAAIAAAKKAGYTVKGQ